MSEEAKKEDLYWCSSCFWVAGGRGSYMNIHKLFHDGGRYHIETSPLIGTVNQWTGFYMITTSVMKVLKEIVMLRVPYKII